MIALLTNDCLKRPRVETLACLALAVFETMQFTKMAKTGSSCVRTHTSPVCGALVE